MAMNVRLSEQDEHDLSQLMDYYHLNKQQTISRLIRDDAARICHVARVDAATSFVLDTWAPVLEELKDR